MKLYLDTNRLIAHWRRCRKKALDEYSEKDVEDWAESLIRDDGTAAILTPVVLEFLCGTMSPHDLKLSRAYLARFKVVDEGRILAEDWEKAKGFAAWNRDRKPRDFADYLLAAIARRLGYEPLTSDLDHRRRSRSND